MKFRVVLLLVLTLICLSCDKKNLHPRGNLYVAVKTYGPVAGANVFTVPPTKQGVTDNFGSVLLRDLDFDTYEVYATHPQFGSGKSVVKIMSDSLNATVIQLSSNTTIGFIPSISLILPVLPANFKPNEKVVFSFKILDDDSPASDIDVVINSNLDGKLYESHPDASNFVSFETSVLTRGVHHITVTATDKDKYSTTKTFDVSTTAPAEIVLESAAAVDGKVKIKWLRYNGSDFLRYELYRAPDATQTGSMITSFNSVDSVSYTDKIPPLVSEIYYYVKILNSNDSFRNSNRINVGYPGGKIYFYSVIDAVHHPTDPIIYILDNAGYKLRAINYETNMEVSSTTIQGTAGKMDIGNNGYGLEIYLPSSNGNIYVYDAASLNLVSTIATGLPVKSVVTASHGYIAASLSPSPWWEQPVRTYSRSTGINVSGNAGTGVFEANILRLIPNTDKIISISTSVSPVDMDYFEIAGSGVITLHADDSYHGDHLLDPYIFRISSNGEYLVTDKTGAVYGAAQTMIYKGTIDRGAMYFSDFVFSTDCKIIYAGTSNRNSIQIVKYPELTRTNEIMLKGYPKFLFFLNGNIISISKVSATSENIVFEKIKVE